MRRKVFFLAVFALWAATAAAGEVTVQSCSDGDTCTIQVASLALKVRLAGIDAPEIGRRKGGGQPFAREAKETLNGMVAGKDLQVSQYGIDAFNRPLVAIRTETGGLANEEMVRLGLAEVYEGPGKFDLSRLRDLQAQAKSSGRGAWSLGSRYVSPYLYRKRAKASVSDATGTL